MTNECIAGSDCDGIYFISLGSNDAAQAILVILGILVISVIISKTGCTYSSSMNPLKVDSSFN